MATHSSVLAWRILGMGDPGGLLFMRSHRVGHDRSDLAAAAAAGSSSKVQLGFPGGLAVKNPPVVQEPEETLVRSLGWEDPLKEIMATTPVFIPGESHGQSSLAVCSPWGSQRVRHH